jgi:membrane protease subunit HflK
MRWVWYILAVVVVGYLLTGVSQIRPGERAIVTRWGRIVDTPGPGLLIGYPYGIDRVQHVSVDAIRRVQVGFRPDFDDEEEAPPGQMLTGDHNLVNVQVSVDFTVKDAEVSDYIVYQERAEGIVGRAAEAVLSEWTARHKIDEVLTVAKAELPSFLVHDLERRLMPYRLGVEIQGASVSYLQPPNEVRAAFDDVSRAQAAIRAREHEARQRGEREVRQAEAEANRIEKSALAYVNEQVTMARADADAFEKRLQEYQQHGQENPDYLAGIWWQEIGKLFTKLKANGRIDLLDHHLNRDGLDITTWQAPPEKK